MNTGWTLRAGWLIDGTGGPVRRHIDVKINGGRLVAIGPSPDDGGAMRDWEATVDLRHATVIPGLIDCHVHLFMSATIDERRRQTQLTDDIDTVHDGIARRMERLLKCGVVAVRDGGDRHGYALSFVKDSTRHGVTVRCAGTGWHAAGRYGRLIAKSPAVSLSESISRQGPRSDWVKIVNSGLNSLTEFARQGAPQFPPEELAAAVAAAGRAGRPVMVHANGRQAVGDAIRAGCRSIEHGFFMGRRNLQRMAQRGVYWIPTAVTMQGLAMRVDAACADAGVCQRNLDHQIEQLTRARELGVKVAVGTDAGTAGVNHGPAVADEMRLLAFAGFSLPQVVQCATGAGAELLGLGDLGRLVAGARATLIAVQGPPERLLDNIRRPLAICLDGRWQES